MTVIITSLALVGERGGSIERPPFTVSGLLLTEVLAVRRRRRRNR
jgi:hypothetical protein